jgi:hypothetical protein
LNFSDSDQAGGSKGRPGKTGQGPLDDQPRNRLNPDTHRETDHAKLHSENVPAKYRSAVKRYFTPDDTPEPTP